MERLLIVDDDRVGLDLWKRFLNHAGHECVTAENGEEGRAQLEQAGKFDKIVCDTHMPLMNGVEFLTYMRMNARYDKITFFLMSGKTSLMDGGEHLAHVCARIQAETNTQVVFLPKPVDIQSFIDQYLGGEDPGDTAA